VGGVAFRTLESRRDAYLQLPQYVPVEVDPESSDFLYQINLPKIPTSTGVPNIQLNRLTKWSVFIKRPIAMALSELGFVAQTSGTGIAGLRVELDLNTTASEVPLPREQFLPLVRELVSIGIDLPQTGVRQRVFGE
jgi:hypothetical protein